MRKTWRGLWVCGLICFSTLFDARPVRANWTVVQRVRFAQQIIDEFSHRYAMLAWKEQHLGIHFADVAAALIHDVANAGSNLEYYEGLRRFAAKWHDGHVGITPLSTLRSDLGFNVNWFGHSVLITHVDRAQLPFSEFPFRYGDALIAIDGVPVTTKMQELAQTLPFATELAGRSDAASFLTHRPQKWFQSLPQGRTLLRMHSVKRNRDEDIAVYWTVQGTPLADESMPETVPTEFVTTLLHGSKAATTAVHDARKNLPSFSLWPELVVLQDQPVLAGILPTENLRIGYLRIHSWLPKELGDQEQLRKNIAQLIVADFSTTDALILDMTDNGGGNYCHAQEVASFLFATANADLQMQMRAIRSIAFPLEDALKNAKTPEQRALITQQLTAVQSAMQQGLPLTAPIAACTYSGRLGPMTNADGTVISYDKPVLVLLNRNSASATEFMSAALQDAGRAVVLGETSAGLGGEVVTQENWGPSDITTRITDAVLIRNRAITLADGSTTRMIENIGVIPDVPYEWTELDLQDDFANYRQAIVKTVEVLLKH